MTTSRHEITDAEHALNLRFVRKAQAQADQRELGHPADPAACPTVCPCVAHDGPHAYSAYCCPSKAGHAGSVQ